MDRHFKPWTNDEDRLLDFIKLRLIKIERIEEVLL